MPGDEYRFQAWVYDRVLEPVNAPLRQAARRLLPPDPGHTVMDLGCGTGAALAEYREIGCRVVGADTSESMLAQARQRLGKDADLRLITSPRVPFDDDSADLVLLSLVLHSIPGEQAVTLLAEAGRLLRGGGNVLVTDFAAGQLRWPRAAYTRGLTVAAELAAGPRHARNAWRYLRAGGLEPIASAAGLRVDRSKVLGAGNIVIAALVAD